MVQVEVLSFRSTRTTKRKKRCKYPLFFRLLPLAWGDVMRGRAIGAPVTAFVLSAVVFILRIASGLLLSVPPGCSDATVARMQSGALFRCAGVFVPPLPFTGKGRGEGAAYWPSPQPLSHKWERGFNRCAA